MQRYKMQLSSSESAMAELLLKLLIALNRFPLLFIIRKKKNDALTCTVNFEWLTKRSLSRPWPLLPLSLPVYALDVIGCPLNAIVDGALTRLDLSESGDKTLFPEVVDLP